MSDGSRAVGLLNRSGAEAEVTARWTDLGYPEQLNASVRDLWSHSNAGMHKGSYATKVPSHGVVVLRVTPQ